MSAAKYPLARSRGLMLMLGNGTLPVEDRLASNTTEDAFGFSSVYIVSDSLCPF